MARFTLRFYGRFVFAEPRTGGQLTVLAIDPYQVKELGADPHRFIVAVARPSVSRSAESRTPTVAMMPAVDATAEQLEQVTWDLTGFDVKPQSTEPLTWEGDKTLLPSLNELTNQSGRFERTGARSQAAVYLSSGVVTPKRMGAPWQFDFVRVGSPHGAAELSKPSLADMVEVVLNVDGNLRLELSPRAGSQSTAAGIIEVKPAKRGDTIVSLSHLCGWGSNLDYDKEFAGLYEALENAPRVTDRLVPRPMTPFTEVPCLSPGHIHY